LPKTTSNWNCGCWSFVCFR